MSLVYGGVKRSDVNKYRDKKVFHKTAARTHYLNTSRKLMRGGIRL